MNSAWVFAPARNDEPEWHRNHQAAATEVRKLKKLQLKVVMCCSSCVDKVEEVVKGMHGVFDVKTDRWNDRVTIFLTPGGRLDESKLVRKLKRVTHEKKVKILDSSATDEAKQSGSNSSSSTTTTVVYGQNPSFGPGFNPAFRPDLVPWSSSSSSYPPFINNPFYLQHPVGCPNCARFPGAVCANCGRGNGLGARFY